VHIARESTDLSFIDFNRFAFGAATLARRAIRTPEFNLPCYLKFAL
jgi:hypothetical protein